MRKMNIGSAVTTGIVIVLVVVLGVWLVVHNNVKSQLGEIRFSDEVSEADRELVNSARDGLEFIGDITVSTEYSIGANTAAEESANTAAGENANDAALVEENKENKRKVLMDVLVPVEDFYSTKISITLEELELLVAGMERNDDVRLISVQELDAQTRLLAVDNDYYLDDLESGAAFRYLVFSKDADADDSGLAEIVTGVEEKSQKFATSAEILTLAQTGVTALSRGMYTKLKSTGNNGAYFAQGIGEFLQQFDLTHTSNEASFSAAANSQNICAAPEMIDALTGIGLDIVELTGNHNIDCGDDDAIGTIDKYAELGIKTFGGGKDADSAVIPIEIEDKGTNLTLLGYNLSTGGYTLDNSPGANFYTEEKASQDIQAAKERGDFVIVDVQYYECNEYVFTTENTTCDRADSAAGDQIGLFRHLIDLGADVVVGTSAHQPQTYEKYGDGEIYYGLGNLFFDQVWWPGTTRSIILVHYFKDGKLLQTRLVPTIYGDDLITRRLDDSAASEFLTRLVAVSPRE